MSIINRSHDPALLTVLTQLHFGLCRTKMPEGQHEKEDDKRFYIKKPLNAFMLYMREERPKVVAQCNVKESATINQILGQRVSLSTPPTTCFVIFGKQE